MAAGLAKTREVASREFARTPKASLLPRLAPHQISSSLGPVILCINRRSSATPHGEILGFNNQSEQKKTPAKPHKRNAKRFQHLLEDLGSGIGRLVPRSLFGRRQTKKARPDSHQERQFFQATTAYHDQLKSLGQSDQNTAVLLETIREFAFSPDMKDLIAKAAVLEPEIGDLPGDEINLLAPLYDWDFEQVQGIFRTIPNEHYNSIVLMPSGRMGGADLIAAILARALATRDRVLILRTDDAQWDRPEWYPDNVVSVDISALIQRTTNPRRALYAILCEIGAERIYNLNSRLAFETLVNYGARLAWQFKLYAYYFCSDLTPSGAEAGYPVQYFAPIFPHLTAAFTDSQFLAEKLRHRFAIPKSLAGKIVTLNTPTRADAACPVLAETQVARAKSQPRRPRLLWGGRLDRQKRFDLLVAVARAMPDVDFLCWGKAVLDPTPDTSDLPANLKVHPPFHSYEELPLTDCDGWFYTSAWDGLPTVLSDIGGYGMPVAASAVGGVPELIDDQTGWAFSGTADAVEVAATLRDMLSNAEARIERARALQLRVRKRHTMDAYEATVLGI